MMGRRRSSMVAVGVGVAVLATTGLAAASGSGESLEVCVKKDRLQIATDDKPCAGDEESVVLATSDAVDALSASNATLANQVGDLEALVDRLHGGNAAYIEDSGGSGSGPAVSGVGAYLAICPDPGDDDDCDWDDSATAVLYVDGLDGDDDGLVVTFDEAEVQKAIALFTDGVAHHVDVRHFPGSTVSGGGSGLLTNDTSPFRDQSVFDPFRPTALEGVPVSDIVLYVRDVNLFTDNGTSSYSWNLRWYFRL